MTLRTGARIDVRNPRTGEIDASFVAPSAAELKAEVARLRAAQAAWRDAGLPARIAVLQRWREALAARSDALVAALSQDTGRLVIARSELQVVLATIDRWCRQAPTLALPEEGRSEAIPTIAFRSQHVPYSLVGVISPWNFPLTLAFIDAVPALLAGCAVFVKPSEITPRWIETVNDALRAVPELQAVLHIESGARETGEALVAASDIVCFTGSVKTGRAVAENAARHFVPAFLELGGKDPVIVTASADVERSTDIVLRASCLATGQACQSLERVYVAREIFAPFVERLVAKAKQVTINWPDIRGGTLGPFIWAPQAATVASQIAEAVERGAKVLSGGEIIDHGGKWMLPTVMVDVDASMRIVADETFGPVMPVMPFDSIDEAVALANEGIFGLSAAVIAGSLDEAEAIGLRLDVGAVSLNDGALTGVVHEAEKQSFKMSGLGGSRMGPSGYLRFFRRKALIRQSGAPMPLAAMAEDAAAPRPATR